jgi:hypothetical protein
VGALAFVCGVQGQSPTGNQFTFEYQLADGTQPSTVGPLGTYVKNFGAFLIASSDGPITNSDTGGLVCSQPNDGTDVLQVCWPNLLPLPPFSTPIAEPSTTWSQKIACPNGSGTTGSMHVDRSADGTVFQAVIDDPGYAQHVLSVLYNNDPTQLPPILRMFTADNVQLGVVDASGNAATGTPVKMIISNLVQSRDPWDGQLSGYSVALTGFSAFVEITWDGSSPPHNIGETTRIQGLDANNQHVSRFVGASGGQCSGG